MLSNLSSLSVSDFATWTHDQFLDAVLAVHAVFTFAYFISAMVVAGNVYAGFLAIFTAMVFATFNAGTYYGLHKANSRIVYGAILGAAVFLVFITLQTAIFWGQYSNCDMPKNTRNLASSSGFLSTMHHTLRERLSGVLPEETFSSREVNIVDHMEALLYGRSLSGQYGVQCFNTAAMQSLCAFAVLLFLATIVLVAVLIAFKNEILSNVPFGGNGVEPHQLYTDTSGNSTSTAAGGSSGKNISSFSDFGVGKNLNGGGGVKGSGVFPAAPGETLTSMTDFPNSVEI